jgi:hypothetical protein
MQTVGLVLSAIAAVVGLVAALYWYKSGTVPVNPKWPTADSVEPGGPHGSLMFANGITAEQIRATIEAFGETAGFNKKAAILTAVSVALGAVGTFLANCAG